MLADFFSDWECWQAADPSLRSLSPSCQVITKILLQELIRYPGLLVELVVPEAHYLRFRMKRRGIERRPKPR